MNIKQSIQTGIFYPQNKEDIIQLFKEFDDNNVANYASRLIIVPHAGYSYSGKLAFNAYKYLDKNVKNVFIFAPTHYKNLYGCNTCDYDAFSTPLGNVQVNKDLTLNFSKLYNYAISNDAFENEHSIEVQLPFIKYFLPNAQIVPILYGCENYKNLSECLSNFWDNPENAFIISSDLSHFYPEKEALKIDDYTARMIENNDIRDFEIEQACGAVGICTAVNFAKIRNFTFIRLGLTNSSKMTGDTSSVVGYGSWFLYEGEKNKYIKENYSELLLKIARESILSGLQLGAYFPQNVPCVLEENAACFVTLETNGELRGCIGSIVAHKPLIDDLYKNAHTAAFSDPRFSPLSIDEYKKLDISISLLSPLKHQIFSNEEELLSLITPYVDGVLIRDGLHQAVFLPAVWTRFSDKHDFINTLKQKAGISSQNTLETFEAFTFQVTTIV